MVIHELAKVDASHAITVSAHTTLGTSPIVDFGTAEQKQRYVPLLAAGKVLGGFGLTEPGAGSDAGGTSTVAVEQGDHYVLNGSKIFITHAGVGEIFVVTARTDPAAQRTRGITAFIVTKDTTDLEEAKRVGVGHDAALPKCRGVMAAKKEDKLGWRASDTRELVLQDAIVPKENVLGPVNNGFRQFLHTRHHQSRAAARRLRLYDGLPRRADDAGREDLRDRRGHERDSAHCDREAAARRSGRLTKAG